GVGVNWPSAGRVYVAGEADRSTTPEDPARAFAITADAGMTQARVLVGVGPAIQAWDRDPDAAAAAMQRMVDDAGTHGLQL
ncbi:hypothetical protein ACXWQI_09550, partial [Streptococcus pyogenes]